MYYLLNKLSSLNGAYIFSFILIKKGKAKEERVGEDIIEKKEKCKGRNVAHTKKKEKEVETKSCRQENDLIAF